MMDYKIKEYQNNKITVEELVHYFDTNNYTKEEIKKNGIVYTPKYISDYIVKKLNPKINETIFEPSIGHGIFIFSLLEYIQKENNLSNKELKEYFLKNVYGQDLQEQNIKEYKEILIIYFKKINIELKEEDIINYSVGNTLNNKSNKEYDIIIGNPPYVNIRNMDKEDLTNLRANYNSCKKGNIDLYYAFIEYAFNNSKRCSFITPNSWLYNSSAKNLRKLVKKDLVNIIDFKQFEIFESVSTYTSIFLINKKIKNKKVNYFESLKGKSKKINKDELDDGRWSFFNKRKMISLPNLVYHTPIATLRDKIYIKNELNKENKDLISFYKISKIKEEKDFFNSEQKIIFPYKLNKEINRFVIKKEEELDNNTLNYLLNNKDELNKRDKGKVDKYDSWYAYGRRQGLNKYKKDTYLIIIPGMISKDFIFFSINTNKVKKPFLFSSGFLLEVVKADKEKLLTYLNSNDFKKFMINNGKVWKGKTEESSYYSLSMTQLRKIFI